MFIIKDQYRLTMRKGKPRLKKETSNLFHTKAK